MKYICRPGNHSCPICAFQILGNLGRILPRATYSGHRGSSSGNELLTSPTHAFSKPNLLGSHVPGDYKSVCVCRGCWRGQTLGFLEISTTSSHICLLTLQEKGRESHLGQGASCHPARLPPWCGFFLSDRGAALWLCTEVHNKGYNKNTSSRKIPNRHTNHQKTVP